MQIIKSVFFPLFTLLFIFIFVVVFVFDKKINFMCTHIFFIFSFFISFHSVTNISINGSRLMYVMCTVNRPESNEIESCFLLLFFLLFLLHWNLQCENDHKKELFFFFPFLSILRNFKKIAKYGRNCKFFKPQFVCTMLSFIYSINLKKYIVHNLVNYQFFICNVNIC